MTHRTKHGRFAPLALAAGLSAAITSICVVAPNAAAQSLPAAPPIVVYVMPGGQPQAAYTQRDAAVLPQPRPTTPPAALYASRPAVPSASPTPVRPAALVADTETVTKTAYQVPDDSAGESSDDTAGGASDCECGPYVDGCSAQCGPYLSCIAGMELTWIKPEIDDGTLSTELVDTAGVGREVSYDIDDFDAEDVQIAPRFWLGLQGDCWGVVTRFWQIDATESDHSIFIGGADVGYDFASELDLYTIDLEVTGATSAMAAMGMAW